MLRDRTGQLTARLGQDLMQMLQPLNWALSQLLQNILSLGGGLFMCQSTHHPCHRPPPPWLSSYTVARLVVTGLFVSWKLSMLAFTSIFPVRLLTPSWFRSRADSSGCLWVVR